MDDDSEKQGPVTAMTDSALSELETSGLPVSMDMIHAFTLIAASVSDADDQIDRGRFCLGIAKAFVVGIQVGKALHESELLEAALGQKQD